MSRGEGLKEEEARGSLSQDSEGMDLERVVELPGHAEGHLGRAVVNAKRTSGRRAVCPFGHAHLCRQRHGAGQV